MAFNIRKDECINCGACEVVCPVEAISEVNEKRWINPEKCVDCGACAQECPVNCIDSP